MNHLSFEALARRMDRRAHDDPKAYRREVLAFVAFGFAVLYGVALGLLLLAGVLLGRALCGDGLTLANIRVWGPAVLLVGLVGLWLRMPVARPRGRPLRRDEAPALFAMLDSLARAVGTRAPDRVLVTTELNAALVQTPRYAFAGEHVDLLIGLPLVLAVDAETLRAVVAHELGHLRGAHARMGRNVGTLARAWQRVAAARQRTGSVLLLPLASFAHWYAPRLAARVQALRRRHELEADRAAAAATSEQALGAALVALELGQRWLEERFVPALRRAAPAEVPRDLHARMQAALVTPLAEAPAWLASALGRAVRTEDTHPPLAERLRACGCDPDSLLARALDRTQPRAAAIYLETALVQLTTELDAAWAALLDDTWRRRVADRQRQKRHRQTLEGIPAPNALARFRCAVACHELGDDRAAVVQLREVLLAGERPAAIIMLLGELLQEHDDARCVAFLEEAAGGEPRYAAAALELAAQYALEHGSEAEAQRLRARVREAELVLTASEDERAGLMPDVELMAPALPDGDLATLRAVLGVEAGAQAYLVRRVVRRTPDHPCHWLLLDLPRARRSAEQHWLATLARVTLSSDVRVAPLRRLPRALRGRAAAVWVDVEPDRRAPESAQLGAGLVAVRPLEGLAPEGSWSLAWFSLAAVAAVVVGLAAPVRATRTEASPRGGFAPLVRSGAVAWAGAASELAPGERCALRIAILPQPAGRCVASLACGGRSVYGGPRGGWVTCHVVGANVLDANDPYESARDGDPTFTFDAKSGVVGVDTTLDSGVEVHLDAGQTESR